MIFDADFCSLIDTRNTSPILGWLLSLISLTQFSMGVLKPVPPKLFDCVAVVRLRLKPPIFVTNPAHNRGKFNFLFSCAGYRRQQANSVHSSYSSVVGSPWNDGGGSLSASFSGLCNGDFDHKLDNDLARSPFDNHDAKTNSVSSIHFWLAVLWNLLTHTNTREMKRK